MQPRNTLMLCTKFALIVALACVGSLATAREFAAWNHNDNDNSISDSGVWQLLQDLASNNVGPASQPQQALATTNDDDEPIDANSYALDDENLLADVADDTTDNDESASSTSRLDDIYLLEDRDYPKSLYEHYPGVGQVSGIAALPSGDVVVFHRGDRVWNETTFDARNNTLAGLTPKSAQERLIKNHTIMIIDRDTGSPVTTLAGNLFYMPHSVASDPLGNIWLTDVARHQVMRLPTSSLHRAINKAAVAARSYNSTTTTTTTTTQQATANHKRLALPGNLTKLWPDIIVGEPFVPGSDAAHFCQPAEVRVSSDGRFVYVADGYCNARIVVLSAVSGQFVAEFGREHDMQVVHSLTLFESRNLLCAADRERARILCFRAGLDGDLDAMGELVFVVNYPIGRVFSIEAISDEHMLVSSNQRGTSRYDLAALNPFTSELKQVWTSSDLLAPHAISRTRDSSLAYVADMSRDAYKKVFKFDIIRRRQ